MLWICCVPIAQLVFVQIAVNPQYRDMFRCCEFVEALLYVVQLIADLLWTSGEFVTFRVRHSRGEMYIGHGCLCVCLSVPCRIPTLLHGPGCNLRNGRGAL